jgi:hypothetical protein
MDSTSGSGTTNRPEPLALLCVGGSHLRCIVDAAEAGAGFLDHQRVRIHAIRLSEPKYKPNLEGKGGGGALRVQARLRAEIERLRPECDEVILSIGGNAHNALGLVESEQPFDFVLNSDPALPLLPQREVVPEETVRAALMATKRFEQQMLARRLILELLGPGAVHLDIPPPVQDERHIVANGGVFAAEIQRFGVAPPDLRYKLWRLYGDMVREQCAQGAAVFLDVPATACDGRYLARQSYAADPTHANEWYGRRVIEQLIGRHRSGFTWPEDA